MKLTPPPSPPPAPINQSVIQIAESLNRPLIDVLRTVTRLRLRPASFDKHTALYAPSDVQLVSSYLASRGESPDTTPRYVGAVFRPPASPKRGGIFPRPVAKLCDPITKR